MDDKPRLVQVLWYPVYDPAQPLLAHTVGFMGVTRIEEHQVAPEPYCYQTHFLVFKGDQLFQRLDARGAGAEYVKSDGNG